MGDRKAVLCGYYGKGNGGDEALLASLLQMLPPQIQPIVLSGHPQETTQRYGVESCDRASLWQILTSLRQSDYFIWGGGSLMQDVTSFASPLYYGGLMALAQQQGLQTIAWAQGIGPLQRRFTRWLTRQVLGGCVAVSVRDRASAQLLADWHLNGWLAPDPVWALDALPYGGGRNSKAPQIAVTLRPHRDLTPRLLNILTQALARFQAATETTILLVPFQKSQDLALAEAIAPQLPGPSQIILLEDPRALKGLFQTVEFAIGMRLHSLIMAAAEQCSCFALSYDPKVSQLMAEVAIPGWELAQIPEDPEYISQQWLLHYQGKMALDGVKIQSLRDRALLHRELLGNVMA